MSGGFVAVSFSIVAGLVMLAGCSTSVGESDRLGTSEAELRRRACYSSTDCSSGSYCTTEDGVCDSPCRRGEVCIQVCTGVCKRGTPAPAPEPVPLPGEACGTATCATGMVCCNSSCGICTDPGGFCTQQLCEPVPAASECTVDADCRAFSDYCTGCDCRALTTTEADPVCDGVGVRCFADPCMGRTAACVAGACVLQ